MLKENFNNKFKFIIFNFGKDFKFDEFTRLKEFYNGPHHWVFEQTEITIEVKKEHYVDLVVSIFSDRPKTYRLNCYEEAFLK